MARITLLPLRRFNEFGRIFMRTRVGQRFSCLNFLMQLLTVWSFEDVAICLGISIVPKYPTMMENETVSAPFCKIMAEEVDCAGVDLEVLDD